jgi:hypothetical protein
MGKFHKYLVDAAKAIDNGEWDEAVKILKDHQLKHVNKSENIYGIIQRMIDSLNLYQGFIDASIKFAQNKNPEAIVQIRWAKHHLKQLTADIKKLLDMERITLE